VRRAVNPVPVLDADDHDLVADFTAHHRRVARVHLAVDPVALSRRVPGQVDLALEGP
jgi:hypothetical protein